MEKIRLIYVLGPAYSGSTLFGLTLGKHDQVTNLGEVTNLRNDFQLEGRCSCGASLSECPFWATVAMGLEQSSNNLDHHTHYLLNDQGRRHIIDQRGGLKKILFPFISIFKLYPHSVIAEYLRENREVFSACNAVSGRDSYSVDLSKSPERLEILLSDHAFEVRCIFLERDSKDVYSSTMARPKRTRSMYGFKAMRESLWLALRNRQMNKVFASVPVEKRIKIKLDDFLANPGRVLDGITSWLGIPEYDECEESIRTIPLRNQHIFVGNRWLFKEGIEDAVIRQGYKSYNLTFPQWIAFKLFN